MSPRAEDEREDLEQLDEGELDLLAYLDGELEGDRAAAVEARLRTDRAYAARYKAMKSIGAFLRGDADRIYRSARVDDIVDDVLAKVRSGTKQVETPPLADVIPVSQIAPPTSRLTRTKKNTVIWVAFGGIAAAAAALVVWTSSHDKVSPHPVASTSTPASAAPAETVAVKIIPPPPSNPPIPETASTVEVEDLEVGSGATVIYTRGEGDEGSSPVVWITAREAK